MRIYKIVRAPTTSGLQDKMNTLALEGYRALTVFPESGTIVAVMERKDVLI